MRVVLDTNVIVAALRSPTGAAAKVVRLVLTGELSAAATTALLLEYEAVSTRPEHLLAARLSAAEALVVIDALAIRMDTTPIRWLLRPSSPDPGDDFVIEAAVNARADTLVSANIRDLAVPLAAFGIRTISPGVLLSELRSPP